jgi:hypothetical protein
LPRLGSEEPVAEWAIRRMTKDTRDPEQGNGAQTPEAPAWRGARNGNFAAAVYGSILAAGVVASLDVGDVGAGDMIAALAGTMVVFWLAHVWAEGIADRMHDPRPYTWRRLRAAAAWHWPMVQAATGPLLALALAGLGAWTLDTGVTLALAISIAQLVGWGIAVGRRTFDSWPAALASGAVDGLLGMVLIVLKTLVH